MLGQTARMAQPNGFYAYFTVQIFERFGFYSVQYLLLLFAIERFAFDLVDASLLFSSYISMIYASTIVGGIAADRYLGYRLASIAGLSAMACGCLMLSLGSIPTTYLGLALLITGNGLFKPCITTLVGLLYGTDNRGRDVGFTIYYMGINIGAGAAALLSGFAAENFGYGPVFFACALAKCVALAILANMDVSKTQDHGPSVKSPSGSRRKSVNPFYAVSVFVFAVMIAVLSLWHYALPGVFILSAAVFCILCLSKECLSMDGHQRRNIVLMLVVFGFSAVFWMAFAQHSDLVVSFFRDSLDRQAFGLTIPSSSFISLNTFFVIVGAPVVSWIFASSTSRRRLIEIARFSCGLLLMALAYFALAYAAQLSIQDGAMRSAVWAILFFALLSFGELFISPIGLSMVSRLAPKNLAGFAMGMWFLMHAIGAYFGGVVTEMIYPAGELAPDVALAANRLAFDTFGYLCAGSGLLLLLGYLVLGRYGTDGDRAG
ncbi:MAG: peptide MFS transporter [Pseudomonadota bacterium]